MKKKIREEGEELVKNGRKKCAYLQCNLEPFFCETLFAEVFEGAFRVKSHGRRNFNFNIRICVGGRWKKNILHSESLLREKLVNSNSSG